MNQFYFPCDQISTLKNLIKKTSTGHEDKQHNNGGLRVSNQFKENINKKPLISIITVVYNNSNLIEETIRSVLFQDYDNVEYIIIDGKSTDSTLDIIKKYNDCVDYWISEPDSGIYNAMNKGILLTNGAIINFLNADDHFIDSHVLSRIAAMYCKYNLDIIYGDVVMFSKENGNGWIRKGNIHKLYFLFKGIPQQAFFYQRYLFKKYGMFDERFKIAADFDFFLKLLFKKNLKIYYYNSPVVIFNTGATSSNKVNLNIERNIILQKSFNKLFLTFFKNSFFQKRLANNDLINRKISFIEKILKKISCLK